MKLAPWYLAAILPVAVAGCAGAFLGHFAVLLVVAGIFFGTLSLGKTPTIASGSGGGRSLGEGQASISSSALLLPVGKSASKAVDSV
jgi:hypothetical protein